MGRIFGEVFKQVIVKSPLHSLTWFWEALDGMSSRTPPLHYEVVDHSYADDQAEQTRSALLRNAFPDCRIYGNQTH